MKEVFNQSKAFFDLDVEEKMKLKWNNKKSGYKALGEELVNQANMSKGGTKVGPLLSVEFSRVITPRRENIERQ